MKLSSDILNRVHKKVQLPNNSQVLLVEAPIDGSWSSDECQSNIFCVDFSGEVVWRVRAGVPKCETDSFVGLKLDDGRLKASRFFGDEYEIDSRTGVAEETGWHK